MLPSTINIFEKAARKAGRILARDFGEIENLQIQSKNVGDFVTSADLKVEETEAVVKGQTAASSYKPAILTGGIKTSVPPFISTEDYIVISTTNASYVEKVKK